MADQKWRFINEKNPVETIVVHDADSAARFIQVLQRLNGETWTMLEERPLVIPAPSAAGTSSTASTAPSAAHAAPTGDAAPAVAPMEDPAIAAFHEAVEEVEKTGRFEVPVREPAEEPIEEAEVAPARKPLFSPRKSEERTASIEKPAEKAIEKPIENTIEKPEKKDRRKQQRFSTEFRVILISGNSSFRTLSRDISLGGMKLKKAIPPSLLKQKCVVYISNEDSKENLEMVCNVITDDADPSRIQFVDPDRVQLARLEEWIMLKRARVA